MEDEYRDLLEELDNISNYKGKWQNLWFVRTPRGFKWGGYLYDSSQEAEAAVDKWVEENKHRPNFERFYKSVMQMPVEKLND